MDDKYVSKSEIPQSPRRKSIWKDRFKKMGQDGKVLVLLPRDKSRAHILRSTAYYMAKRSGLHLSTSLVSEEDGLRLYIWLA